MKAPSTLLLAFLAAALSRGASADSLWPGGAADYGNTANIISDTRALKVGDIVTVQISEQAIAQQSSSMKTAKQASVSGGAGQGSWSKNGGSPITSFGAGGQESFDGGGQANRSGRLVTTLSARVISVLESGNLVIEGRRSLKLNEEKQSLYVRGVIRPKDVGRNNTVQSSVMSDAQIMYEGKGPLTEKSRAGFFTRLFDWMGVF
jgi:flagellar L-ring protein precursor FlgH